MSPAERQNRLLLGDADPFGSERTESEIEVTQALPEHVVKSFPGRWVLLRDISGDDVKVIADAEELSSLYRVAERVEGDVTAFVRDPQVIYS